MHLGNLHCEATRNSAPTNILELTFCNFLLGIYTGVELLGHRIQAENAKQFYFSNGCSNLYSQQEYIRYGLLHTLINTRYQGHSSLYKNGLLSGPMSQFLSSCCCFISLFIQTRAPNLPLIYWPLVQFCLFQNVIRLQPHRMWRCQISFFFYYIFFVMYLGVDILYYIGFKYRT